ncbi:hypothetical protein AB0C38_23030 [Amycolatopsis sp. NPDC048633]|uniref:hypothetical protein n=1 Tax=Amycolatopsis sp. NPDC048633 TaxID=3157095 RepID=UPI0033E16D98
MAANEKHDDPDAELARSRQHIEEAKEAAAKVDLADPADEAPETDPPHHQGEQGSTPSGT